MTEDEWLAGRTSPMAMCHHVEKLVSVRKLRLLSTQVCRLIWRRLGDTARGAIEAAEWWAENPSDNQAYSSYFEAFQLLTHEETTAATDAAWTAALSAASGSSDSLSSCVRWVQESVSRDAENGERQQALDDIRARICDLFREIVGNPFRPWKSVPAFLDGGVLQPDGRVVRLSATAVELAEAIHAMQAFDRLPILADALEESGVSDPEILSHCRDAAAHVRGCWALDVVRGKS